MFTGIIEETGIIKEIQRCEQTLKLKTKASVVMEDIQVGDSIALNGICLTVTDFTDHYFSVDVMPETFQASSLYQLKENSSVNLERSMPADGRFGGHFVTGHVDGTGKIRHKAIKENAILFEVAVPDLLSIYLMNKGSITIDGVSLTIFGCDETSVNLSIIPHTANATVLGEKQIGDTVNLEIDMMAKYLYTFVHSQ
ncbi:MAG TPA: riboflavin synthase [Pseudogracilibacillus sp.]|nr:riboflavin synthase [Pseudogracilibacillus sp.]